MHPPVASTHSRVTEKDKRAYLILLLPVPAVSAAGGGTVGSLSAHNFPGTQLCCYMAASLLDL
jgi:hypothetical protein